MNDDLTRVFTEGGTVAHFLDYNQSPNETEAYALCGRTCWPAMWHGTGSQEEEERAADMVVCSRCQAVVTHRRNGYVTP